MRHLTLTLVLATLFMFAGCENPLESSPAQEEGISGTVIDIDLEKMAVDGPAEITIETASNNTQVIHVPSMGLPLCEAYENIEDVYDIQVGDTLHVNGALNEEGILIPCESAEHFLRIES